MSSSAWSVAGKWPPRRSRASDSRRGWPSASQRAARRQPVDVAARVLPAHGLAVKDGRVPRIEDAVLLARDPQWELDAEAGELQRPRVKGRDIHPAAARSAAVISTMPSSATNTLSGVKSTPERASAVAWTNRTCRCLFTGVADA